MLAASRWFCCLAAFLVVVSGLMAADGHDEVWVTRGERPPRKVRVASALADLRGPLEIRLARLGTLLDDAVKSAGGAPLDLMVYPEFALQHESGRNADERAIPFPAVEKELGEIARLHRTWLVVPMTLKEDDGRVTNAAVLMDRQGRRAGVYRKTHPMIEHGTFEGGVTPGLEYPVFECDFGRLGVLICWDMGYPEAWAQLARAGAELIALPSASPQTLQPAAEALRHRVYVVTSTPRDNASLFDPLGRTAAQVTTAPGVLVHQLDLSFAILHWSETLENGHAFQRRFGDAVGHNYSTREDTGLFWSNDPQRPIGSMVRELGLREMPVVVQEVREAVRASRAAD